MEERGGALCAKSPGAYAPERSVSKKSFRRAAPVGAGGSCQAQIVYKMYGRNVYSCKSL